MSSSNHPYRLRGGQIRRPASLDNAASREAVYPTRRRFVQGLALGGARAGIGLGSGSLMAAAMRGNGPKTLRGTHFDLTIAGQAVNFTGAPRIATTVNDSLPAPIKQGSDREMGIRE